MLQGSAGEASQIQFLISTVRELPTECLLVGGPPPEDKILAAEALLGLTIPNAYRTYIQAFGWGGPAPFDFYGIDIVQEVSEDGFPSLVRETLECRGHGFPHALLAISSSGDGGVYMLDAGHEFPGTVQVWYPGSGQTEVLEISDETFEDFLSRAIGINRTEDDD